MTDELDAKLSASLRRAAGSGYDADSASASFSDRRVARVRSRRTAGAVGLGLAVALGALVPTLGRNVLGGDDRSTVGFASGSESPSAEPSPTPGDSLTFTAVPTPKPTTATYDTLPPTGGPKPSEEPVEVDPAPSAPKPYPTGETPPAPPSDDAPYPVRTDDDGRTFTIAVNQGIAVFLDGDESFRWSELDISDTSVVHGESGQATGGDQEWKFVGLKRGRVTITSTQDPACRDSTPPCDAPSRAWQITVVVTD